MTKIITYKKKAKQAYTPVLAIFGLFILAGAAVGIYQYYRANLNSGSDKALDSTINTTTKSTEKIIPDALTLPESKNLNLPYASQAPFSNWAVHEESCEEAALFMYHEYLQGSAYPNNRIPDATIDPIYRAMKVWQVTNYGAEHDLTMEALGKFAKDYYDFSPHVLTNITEKDIKTAIFDGSPVLVPVMTHSLLNNMYGPYTVYHVLMIKGYDATGVITNDAGVGNGPDHHYDWSVLWSAIDAQTSKMGQGRVMLTLSK